MGLYLTRVLKLPDVRFVFADTGWEHKGMFPSRARRFCTEELKVKPIIKLIRELQDEVGDVVNAVGIRAGESEARSKMPEWEWQDDYDCEVWRPLINWAESDVIECHLEHGVSPNPLYLRERSASRVGCYPCIFSKKSEIRSVADLNPEQIDRIRALEAEVHASAEARAEAKGTTLAALGHNAPTFFQAMGALRNPVNGRDGRCVPIDDVVAWSRTKWGGKEYEPFVPETEPGCVRWGLCEKMQQDDEVEDMKPIVKEMF